MLRLGNLFTVSLLAPTIVCQSVASLEIKELPDGSIRIHRETYNLKDLDYKVKKYVKKIVESPYHNVDKMSLLMNEGDLSNLREYESVLLREDMQYLGTLHSQNWEALMSDRRSRKKADVFAEILGEEESGGNEASAAADEQFRKFINAVDASIELLNASWDHPSMKLEYGSISAALNMYDVAGTAARNHAIAVSGYHARTERGNDKSDWILCYKYAKMAKLWGERALSLLEQGKANYIQLRSRRMYDEAYLEAKALVPFMSAEMGYVIVEVYPTTKDIALSVGTDTYYLEIEEQLRSYLNDSDQLGPISDLSILRSLYQLGIETTEEMLQNALTLLTDAHEGLRGFVSNPLSEGSPQLDLYFKTMCEALHYRGVVRRYLSYYQSGFMSKFYMKEAEVDVKKSLSLYTEEFEKQYAAGKPVVTLLALDMVKATFSSFRISLQLSDKTQEAREAFKHHHGLQLFVKYSETLPLYPLADIKNEIFAALPSVEDFAQTNQDVLDGLIGREESSQEECDSSNNRRKCFDLAANLLSIAYYQMMMGLHKSSYESFDQAMDLYDTHLLEGETPMQYFDIKGGFPVPERVSICFKRNPHEINASHKVAVKNTNHIVLVNYHLPSNFTRIGRDEL